MKNVVTKCMHTMHSSWLQYNQTTYIYSGPHLFSNAGKYRIENYNKDGKRHLKREQMFHQRPTTS